jgi:hypothetical protein
MDSLFEALGVGVKAVSWVLGAVIVLCLLGGAFWVVLYGVIFKLLGGG